MQSTRHTQSGPTCAPLSQKEAALLSQLIFLFLAGNIALDFIAGLLGISALSQLARIAYAMLCMYVMLRLDTEGFLLSFAAFTFFFLQSAVTQSIYADTISPSAIVYDVSIALKFLLFFVTYRAVRALGRAGCFGHGRMEGMFSYAAVYVPLLYLATYVLGIGEQSYWDGSGFKSVFASLNTINVSMLVLFTYAADRLFAHGQARWLAPLLLNLLSLILLGTKSSYAFIALVLAYYLLVPKTTRARNLLIGCALIGVGVLVFSQSQSLQGAVGKVVSRQLALFGSRSLVDYLTSGRTWMLDLAGTIFADHANPVTVMFGGGYYAFHHELAMLSDYVSTNAVRPVEFDWADVFFSYGTVITLITFSFLGAKLFGFAARMHSCHFQFLSLFVMLCFSCLGGHVLFEAMSSTMLGAVMAYDWLRDESK